MNLSLFLEKHFRQFFIIVLLLAAFNCFFLLGYHRLGSYDEARHAISGYEMVKNGNWIVTTFLEKPDFWNLKPPLGVWMIALSYKVFGVSIFAARFPSALCGFFSIVLIMFFTKQHFGKSAALLAGLILSTSFGFMSFHSARFADFDSQMAFLVMSSLFFLDLTDKKPWFIVLSGLLTGLAFLLKSFAAFQIPAIALVYLIVSGRLFKIRWYQYLLCFIAAILPAAVWAIARYSQDGMLFFNTMLSYDLLKRAGTAVEHHDGMPLFYIGGIAVYFLPWALLFFPFLFYKNRIGIRKFSWNGFYRAPLFWVWAAVPLIMFSIPQTKVYWYINPVYPALAVFTAWHINDLLLDRGLPKGFFYYLRKVMPGLMIFCFLFGQSAALYMMLDRNPTHVLLLGLKDGEYRKGSVVYFPYPGVWQAQMFICKALKGLRFSLTGNEPDIRAGMNNHTMEEPHPDFVIQPSGDTASEFIKNGSKGDLILLEDNGNSRQFIRDHSLTLKNSFQNWLLIEK